MKPVGFPVHVPGAPVTVLPTRSVPEIVGLAVFAGAYGFLTTMLTDALMAARPPGSVTRTRAGNVPLSAYVAVGAGPDLSP